ncbi:DUF3307 domain-containing protein [Domibacillus sp. DTU_2020_1001157_1_SI_ALB_TIR_016]|uniref:DUF3307 domain-containing protein n=1 Tax=Domibacillus sp. DTU_2020_1001157_1_SI_ALB_TIR_016 TaxID=3077789 RepID=UPI0028E5AE4C|nr:DUF3307 domain-containing protein [Domibacillus sp. DTU_2020_1001157_1_SI_ALB_TIR_016]WNS82474.1 DUF3307 domain-containing protein [Domibacillus sp. DTU_2020_1001157_1_SI_ALB_TIR_016]
MKEWSRFNLLLLAHLIGDYLFQTSWMARHKVSRWVPLLAHCFLYTFIVSLFSWLTFGGLSPLAIAFIFLTHVIIKRRTLVAWRVRTVMKARGPESGWLGMIVDQIFHLLVLTAALYL